MLGEDAKYLSDTEEVVQHNLRGQMQYRNLNSKDAIDGSDEGEEESDLMYLQIIRHVRDHDTALFERLKRLPKKARAGWRGERLVQSSRLNQSNDQLVTFFRLGRLKKFFVATVHGWRELDFFEAVDLLRCEPDTPKVKMPKIYYELLQQNKEAFGLMLEGEHEPKVVGGGHTNAKLVLKNIRTALKDRAKLTDEDEDYLRLAKSAYEDGRFPSKTSQRIMNRIKKVGRSVNSLKVLAILRDELDDDLLYTEVEKATTAPSGQREIILSAYLQSPVDEPTG